MSRQPAQLKTKFLYISLHKWLLAPPGTGFLYIKSERAKDIWTTLAGGQWDNHEDEGFRFTQRGTGSLSLLMGLNAASIFMRPSAPTASMPGSNHWVIIPGMA